MTRPLVLVDPPADRFWPLTATRPVAELLAGTRSFRSRWSDDFDPPAAVMCRSSVEGHVFRDAESVTLNRWPDPAAGYRIAISTWVPDDGRFPEAGVVHCDGVPVAWNVDTDDAARLASIEPCARAARAALEAVDAPAADGGGTCCQSIWETMSINPRLIVSDARGYDGADTVSGVDPFVFLGDPADLHVGRDVRVGPFTLLDARDGPIVLDEGAAVAAHAVCTGPLYVGRGSTVLGGSVGHGTSIGPACRVRGEVEQSILQGYANKAHDGFLGHSVVGAWVNLGADTVTSDLKNTYGQVRVDGPDGRVDTDLLKVGAFLGDYVKTGIGSLLTTGARIGVGTHFFGGRAVSPRWLDDFTWFGGESPQRVRWSAFAETVETAMRRRGEALERREKAMLHTLHGGD